MAVYNPERDVSINNHAVSLHSATNAYNYDDCPVIIHIGDRTYKVSRSRLTQRSPIFRDLFSLPQQPGIHTLPDAPTTAATWSWNAAESAMSAPAVSNTVQIIAQASEIAPSVTPSADAAPVQPVTVHLHNDPEEFEHYLWAIHADFLDFNEFMQEPVSAAKCHKLFSIASIAHSYECTRMANRFIGEALTVFEKPKYTFALDARLIDRVLRTTRRWVDLPTVAARARVALIKALRETKRVDPVDLLLSAETSDDKELLGWAYYYLLKRDDWPNETRLRDIDRKRLYFGTYTLGKFWHELCRMNHWANEPGIQDACVPSWLILDKLLHLGASRRVVYRGSSNMRYDSVARDLESKLYDFFNSDP